jgi:hypothetical protein
MIESSLVRATGPMFRSAPLYRLPNMLLGWAKVPIGMPPAKEIAASDGATGTAWTSPLSVSAVPWAAGGAVVLGSGLKLSALSQAKRDNRRTAATGARKRAIRRDNLKLWGIRGRFLSRRLN